MEEGERLLYLINTKGSEGETQRVPFPWFTPKYCLPCGRVAGPKHQAIFCGLPRHTSRGEHKGPKPVLPHGMLVLQVKA